MNHQKFDEEGKNCTILWAEFANLGFGAASSIKKQANIITKADKIVNSKSGKGADFNKHRDILQQALIVNQCNDTGRRSGVNTTGKYQYWGRLLIDESQPRSCAGLHKLW